MMLPDLTKPCRRCGTTDRNTHGACRPCNRAAVVKYQAANLEKCKVKAAKYYAANTEKCKAATDKWCVANPEKCKAHRAKWYTANTERAHGSMAKWNAENPGRKKAIAAKYYAENPEKHKAASAKYYAENPEKAKACMAKWQASHPENRRANDHKRRAQKLKAGGSFAAAEIKVMLKCQREKCVYCRTDIRESYHIDHVMPLALGGHNGISNIQLVCPRCNLTKHAKDPDDFRRERGFLL